VVYGSAGETAVATSNMSHVRFTDSLICSAVTAKVLSGISTPLRINQSRLNRPMKINLNQVALVNQPGPSTLLSGDW
jgi:hypothetical protein